MNKNENFENSVPEDYVLVKHVDAKSDKKQIVIYTLLSFVPLLIIVPVLCVIAYYCSGYNVFSATDEYTDEYYALISIWIVFIVLIVYIVLHELTHGITYKIFTGAKLTFGFTLSVAFCGVPDIYVRKKASIAALIMPFSVFSVVFLSLTIGLWFISPLYGIVAGAVFALHFGGCVGDLHWTLMYLTKFRRCNTLMRDTGPAQWLYIPKSEAEKYGISTIADISEEDKAIDNTEAN